MHGPSEFSPQPASDLKRRYRRRTKIVASYITYDIVAVDGGDGASDEREQFQ